MLMEESTTYQGILEEGREKGLSQGLSQGRFQSLRGTLIRLGTKRFGPPSNPIHIGIQAIRDADRLERLLDRIFESDGWDELISGE